MFLAMPQSPMFDSLEPRQLFATLVPGQSVVTSISTVGTTKNWTVNLVAGRAVTIAAGDTGTTSFAPQISLYSPSGALVATSSGNSGAFITANAPLTGTYTVRLNDVGNNQTGSTRVTAFYYASSITDNDDAFTAESGRRRPATIQPGDLDVWTVNATTKQFLSVLVSENNAGNPLALGVQFIGPNGKIIQQKTNSKGLLIDVPNASAGRYYAVVYEVGQDHTGRYGTSFAIAPGPVSPEDPDTRTTLPANTTRIGGLPSGDIDVFNLNLTAGKTITATFANSSGTINPELLLIDPTGKVVKSANGSSSTTISYKLTLSGTYSLVLRDREADTGGNYSIKYTLT